MTALGTLAAGAALAALGRLRRSVALAITAGAATVLVVGGGPASASCVMPPSLDDAVATADAAFVGTVTALANEGRWATVAVEEVWSGPSLPAVVEVRGGPAGGATSVDRQYEPRTRYLFVTSIAEGRLQDSSCSSTTVWTAELASLRPATARPPAGAPPEAHAGAGPDAAPVAVAVGLAAVAGVVVFGGARALRRRSA